MAKIDDNTGLETKSDKTKKTKKSKDSGKYTRRPKELLKVAVRKSLSKIWASKLEKNAAPINQVVEKDPESSERLHALALDKFAKHKWSEAESLWRSCLKKNGRRAVHGDWVSGLAVSLIRQARLDDAEEIINEGLRSNANDLAIMLAQVDLLITRQNWVDAEVLAGSCYAISTEENRKHILGMSGLYRARSLFHLDRRNEALELIRQTSDQMQSTNIDFRKKYIDLLCDSREMDFLADSMRTGFLSLDQIPYDRFVVFTFLQSNRTKLAAEAFAQSFDACCDVKHLYALPRLASLIFRGEEKMAWFREIDSRAKDLMDGVGRRGRKKLLKVRLKALYGLEDVDGFDRVAQELNTEFPDQAALQMDMAARLKNPNDPAFHKTKIFGIGLSKTGTTSLTEALRVLGFSAAHYFNNFSGEMIADRDIALYDALTDTPISYQFQELYARYPDAKFIYTTRPLEQWKPSLLKHIRRALNIDTFKGFDSIVNGENETRHGELFRDVHNKLYVPFETPEDAYNAHDQSVRDFFAARPEANFLEINFFKGDGYPELAAFLGVPEPEHAFPQKNVAATKAVLAVAPE